MDDTKYTPLTECQTKIDMSIDKIDELIGIYESYHKMFVTSDQPDKVTVTKQTIDDLEKIKRILEK